MFRLGHIYQSQVGVSLDLVQQIFPSKQIHTILRDASDTMYLTPLRCYLVPAGHFYQPLHNIRCPEVILEPIPSGSYSPQLDKKPNCDPRRTPFLVLSQGSVVHTIGEYQIDLNHPSLNTRSRAQFKDQTNSDVPILHIRFEHLATGS